MGYSPPGRKELDTTERLSVIHTTLLDSTYGLTYNICSSLSDFTLYGHF